MKDKPSYLKGGLKNTSEHAIKEFAKKVFEKVQNNIEQINWVILSKRPK
jgi:hypothetical protein